MTQVTQASQELVAVHWNKNVRAISSLVGRLAFLSSLRDMNSGLYIHHGMTTAVGKAAQTIILASHQEAFAEWHKLTLKQQLRDLRRYISNLAAQSNSPRRLGTAERRQLFVQTWEELEPYRSFIPPSAPLYQREAFFAGLTALLAIVKGEATLERATAMGAGPKRT